MKQTIILAAFALTVLASCTTTEPIMLTNGKLSKVVIRSEQKDWVQKGDTIVVRTNNYRSTSLDGYALHGKYLSEEQMPENTEFWYEKDSTYFRTYFYKAIIL